MSAELRRRFLALPVAPCVPSGLCPSDVYVSTRQLRLVHGRPGEQPPSLTLGINPYSRYTFFNVPIQQREPLNAAALYPRVIDALYEAHVQPPAGRPYRPAVILCDDAVMVEMLMADLTGSGTIASVVQLSTAVIDDVLNVDAGQPQTSLLAITNGVFMSMEKMLLQCMQGQADDPFAETGDAKVAQPGRRGKFRHDPSVCDTAPTVLRACGSPACALLSADALKCAGCRRAWYCSKDCQRAAWRVHKRLCKSGSEGAAATDGAMSQ
jgi:hypothetical protein